MTLLKYSLFAVALLSLNHGCAPLSDLPDDAGTGGKAAIVGRIVASDEASKLLAAAGRVCPELRVSVNGSPVSIEFDVECAFVIDGIQPSELVEVRVELVDLGVAGSIEILRVTADELIEIVVEPSADSLTISVERRTAPDPAGELPRIISNNNVSILLPAALYDQGLTVNGNNFTLVGVAGNSCGSALGWTVIAGDVLVNGNNATFRNIQFAGSVTLRGNNTRFINCCFDGELIVFGNNTVPDDGNDNDDDNNDDDDDDDDDDDN